MASITQIRLWTDVGYMEGDIEIPKIGASLPSASLTLEGPFNPSKSRLFSQIQIPTSWTTVRYATYLEATYEMSTGESIKIYGWVDSVTLLSDSDDSPMVQVDWHVDYWRTYNSQMTFVGGLVKRAPSSSFPQTQSITRWEVNNDSIISFMTSFTYHIDKSIPLYWLMISYIDTVGTYSVCSYYTAPLCGANTITVQNYISISGADPATTIDISDLMYGSWDEKLGLDPSKIKGVWISPISPNTLTGDGTKTNPYTMSGWYGQKLSGASAAIFKAFTAMGNNLFAEYDASILNDAVTTDTSKYAITGFDGEVVGSLPWGVTVSNLYYRLVMSANSAYIQIRTGINGHAEGTCYTIPLPVVDTIENAYSTYNYSGQRDYDMSMRQLGVYQQLAGTTQSAIGGAIAGGTSGAGIAGAAVGAASGAGMSLVGAGLNQWVFNPMTQSAKDELVSKQSDGLLISGASYIDTIYHGRVPRLVLMLADSASSSRRSMVCSRYGYQVNTVYSSCQSLINSGGALQISGLSIRGSAPTEAKQYVKSLFERGVKLV